MARSTMAYRVTVLPLGVVATGAKPPCGAATLEAG
jgi:hypothetical protein